MEEPTLRDSTDYNGLKGEKKRIAYTVVAVLLFIGFIYSIVKEVYSHVDDEMPQGKVIDYTK